MEHPTVTLWRKGIEKKDISMISEVLADEVVMYPPNTNEPYQGKNATLVYLSGAIKIFLNSTFRYVNILDDGNHGVLEFTVVISGETIEGMEVITWNQNGKIKQIKLLLRPLNSVTKIHQLMASKHKAGKAKK